MAGYSGPRAWMSGNDVWNSAPNTAPYPSRIDGLTTDVNPTKPAGEQVAPAIIAAAITAAASIGGTIYSNYKQKQTQKEYLALQQKYAKENWELENNYNLPENVKSRLMAAGLNPNLMYGQGAASGQGGAINPQNAPDAYVANPMEGVASMIGAMTNASVQSRLVDSQVELNKSYALKNLAEADATPQDVETRKGHLRVAEGNLNVQQKLLQETIRKNDAFILWNDKQIEEASARISNIAYQNKELAARTSLHEAEAALKKVQSETWAAESKARIAELYSRANLNKEHANLMAEQTITEFQTRAPRIAQILASTDSDTKRAQLLQGEFDAMAEEIFKSQYWTNAAKNGGVATDAVYTFERIIGDLGKVFHGGVGSYTHTSIK